MTSERDLKDKHAPLKIDADVGHIIALAAPLEKVANAAGIYNVFDDGGYRTLLLITMFGLRKPLGRLGDDAVGPSGKTYELKTINLINTKGQPKKNYPGITTEHTLRVENVARYRACSEWLVGVFVGNTPVQVWQIASGLLEPFYQDWERRIRDSGNQEINNPKIPFGFVAQYGTCHPVNGSEGIKIPRPGRFRLPGGAVIIDPFQGVGPVRKK